jgi:hypothetical protein
MRGDRVRGRRSLLYMEFSQYLLFWFDEGEELLTIISYFVFIEHV